MNAQDLHAPEPYAHELHLHSCYSFLEGASEPAELAARAADLGYRSLALTDHDGLHGALVFALACADAGVRPITGVELTLRHGLLDADAEANAGGGPVHLTLLAESARGYHNLCHLVTQAHRETRPWNTDQPVPSSVAVLPPALDPACLAGHTEGLIVLTGCRSGEVARLVDAGRSAEALEAVRRLAALFPPSSTFVELQHNLVLGDTRRVAWLVALAETAGLPYVATGNVHYHHPSRHRLQDALVAIKHRTTLEASHRLRRPNNQFSLRPPTEVAALFAAYPLALKNAGFISERCKDFNLADRRDLGYDFPDFTRQADEQRSTADEVLAGYCRDRFGDRYPPGTDPALVAQAREQLAKELQLIAQLKLSGFFLIYRDLQELATRVAREVRGAGTVRGGSGLPPGRGRGSSVSSIVCYLIGLSHVDPVRNRLFFRRFLNEDLQSIPDIDLDFARDIRERLILAVYEQYGHAHAALVCTFATYHLRSAVRDLGKVLGLPPAAIDKLARLSEGAGADTVRAELDRLPEFQGQTDGPLWAHLVDLAQQVDGFPRHVGQHVGGMIISSRPLAELVPVQPASMPGRFVCQWDKDSCDDARLVKIDFLALGMLSLVEECLELIWQTRGERVDLGSIDYQDPAVYDAICAGDTVGLFQVESRAQIQMLTRSQPRTLDDLAVQVAIVRPGPIVGGAVNPYVRRRERLRQDPHFKPKADHPLLDDLLADTLGIVLYQDQVLEVAMAMGGFTAGQADQFRRSMSRRRSRAAMERFREAFVKGAAERGVAAPEAEAIFDKLCGFSEFGFPKSHAYAFAVLAYQSAWLRHSHLAEYYAALLNNQPMGFYAPHVLIGDARRHGLQVLRVSVNSSGPRCIPRVPPPSRSPLPLGEAGAPAHPELILSLSKDEGRVRAAVAPGGQGQLLLGLTTVKGIGDDLAETLVAERAANGPYRSLADLLRRTALPRRAAESLIAVGALSDFGLGRRELLWQLGLLIPEPTVQVGRAPRGRAPRTARPAGAPAAKARQRALDLPTEQDMVPLEALTDWERMVADYGLLGLSPTYHPLGLMRPGLPADILTSAQLRAHPDGRPADGRRVCTAGLVVCRQRPGTARGFLFLLLEDETGLTNVVVRPDLYEANRGLFRGEPYLVVEGTVQLRSGSLNVLAQRATPLQVPPRLLPGPDDEAPTPMEQAASLPHPPLLHPAPGAPRGPHTPASAQPNHALETLKLATPASHNFH